MPITTVIDRGDGDRAAERGRDADRRAVLAVAGSRNHIARIDARVVEERDHRVHGRDHRERGRPRVADLQRRPEHHELGEPARERRDAGERRQEDRHHDRQPRRRLEQAVVRADLGAARAAGDRDDDRERAEVHRAVHEQIDDDRAERDVGHFEVAVGAGDARRRERHEHESALRDRRVGQHANDVRLAQRAEVAERHRRRREHPHDRPPQFGAGAFGAVEAEEDDVEQGDEAAGLRRHRQERGDRSRRAFVGVGRPEVERHRADLEREADERQEDRDRRAAASCPRP